MSDKLIFNPESISLIDFKLRKGNVETPEEFDSEFVKGHEMDNSIQMGFNLSDELSKTDLVINIKTKSEGVNQDEAICSYHLVFVFKINQMNNFVKLNDKSLIDVHPALSNALASITYSTSRGILLSRLQGTAFSNFILPVVNSNNLLNKN